MIITIDAKPLTALAQAIFEAARVSPPKAKLVAESLVASNLRGVDSHGVQLLLNYLEQIEAGDLNPDADGRIVSENGSCLVWDAQNSLGQVAAAACCAHGVRIAKAQGMSLVTARHSNHFGAAAYWAQKYSAQGLIGIVMCNASSLVAPWQGREPRYGTNPICMAVPGGRWLLDMATTTVAANKIYKAELNGHETIPPGWAMDREGSPTTSVAVALKGLLAPLGGYKGSGLAVMAEILSAALGGGAMSLEVGGLRIRGRPMDVSQMFLGIDVSRFLPLEEFEERIGRLVGMIKSAQPAKGYDEVLVAGEPEWRMEAERLKTGIPLEEGTWKALREAAVRLGVEV